MDRSLSLREDSSHLLSPSNPWYHVASIDYHQNTEKQVEGRLSVLDKCLLNGYNGILLLLFSEFQESAELFHHKIWPSFIVLGRNEFMSKTQEWTNNIKKKKPKPTHRRLQYEEDKFIFKDIYEKLGNNSSELGKCIRLWSKVNVETSISPYLRDLPIPIQGVREWATASHLSQNL